MQDFLEQLDLITSDKALLASHLAKYPQLGKLSRQIVKFVDAETPTPPIARWDEIKAVQTGIYDNWPNGTKVKNKPSRYGLTIEVWTCDPGQIKVKKKNFQHKGNAYLERPKELRAHVARLLKVNNPICKRYAEIILSWADRIEPTSNTYVGLICTAATEGGQGTRFHDFQWVYADLTDISNPKIWLAIGLNEDDEPYTVLLPQFSAYEPDGETKLAAGWIGQSRFDLSGFSVNWPTEVHG